eukprot:2275713-Rhodomonas_salina.1
MLMMRSPWQISMSPDDVDSLGAETPLHVLPDLTKLNDEDHSSAAMMHLSGHLFYSCVQAFPTIVRLWYNDLDRGTAVRDALALCPNFAVDTLEVDLGRESRAGEDNGWFAGLCMRGALRGCVRCRSKWSALQPTS